MDIDKFKNNKTTLMIGHLTPLIILIILFFMIDFDNDASRNIYVLFSLISMIILYVVSYFTKSSPFNEMKMVYSQYGTYFLVTKQVGTSYVSFNICKNIYWILLTDVGNEEIMYWDSDDDKGFNKKIEELFKEKFNENKKRNKMKRKVTQWDGIIDDVTRREKTIDDALK